MKWTTLAVVAASIGLQAVSARAADIVYSTLGPGDSYDTHFKYGADGNGQFHAFLFQPTASGSLDNIVVALARESELTTQTQFNLYSGSDTAMGPLLETFLVPNHTMSPGVLVTMNSASHPFLTAGQDYWLSMTEPGPSNGSESLWMFNDQGIFTSRITDQPTIPEAFAPAFQVSATSATPEPSAEIPIGLSLVVSAFLVRRKLRA